MAPPLNNTSQWRMAFVPFPWPMAHLRRSIRPYPTCPAVPFLEQYLRIAHGFRRLPVDHGPSSGEATAPPQAHGSPWQQLLARTRASARQLDAKFATSKTKLGFGICACHCNIFPWPMNNESTMPPPRAPPPRPRGVWTAMCMLSIIMGLCPNRVPYQMPTQCQQDCVLSRPPTQQVSFKLRPLPSAYPTSVIQTASAPVRSRKKCHSKCAFSDTPN